jgi:hypothetical protein
VWGFCPDLRGACRPEIVETHSNSESVLELFEQKPLLFGWENYNSGPMGTHGNVSLGFDLQNPKVHVISKLLEVAIYVPIKGEEAFK